MADFTPSSIPLGSLASAAAASADLAQQEQQLYGIAPNDPGTTTGIIAQEPDWS
ncbi:MAG TPA: hypothetical protein VLK84_24470 [Longimicrobium sp.]|nr:hypothetical protein [Longimicrobium sp.]